MKRFVKFITLFSVLVLLFGIVFFFWASSPTLSEKESSQLNSYDFPQNIDHDSIYSIVTYNIGHLGSFATHTASKSFYENNYNNAAQLLGAIQPDIIAFQDIDFDSKRTNNVNQSYEFAKLGYQHAADAVYWDKTYILSPYWPIKKQTGKVTSGLTVLSKFNIDDHQRIVLENNVKLPFYKKYFYQDRILQVVKLIVKDKVVVLLNVHLENTSKAARTVQFNQVLAIFKKYATSFPTILLGDFNSKATDEDALVRQLFDMPNVGSSTSTNIDYIFFNTNYIEIVNSRTLNEFDAIAKHIPLYMEFKFI